MITKPNTLNRFLVAFLNFLMLILMSFIFDALVSSRIASNLNGYQSSYDCYETLENEFYAIQDEYHIYIYDEDNNRVINPNLTDEMKSNFLNDTRVVSIKNEAYDLSITIRMYAIVPFIISYILMTMVVYVLPTLFFKKKQNIGMKAFNVVLYKNEEIPLRIQVVGYMFLYIFFHLIIGVLTLFILNIIDLVYTNFNKDHRTLMEKIFNYDFAIDRDKLEANTLSEEKIYEMTHHNGPNDDK